jgi:subtilisin family serine protease
MFVNKFRYFLLTLLAIAPLGATTATFVKSSTAQTPINSRAERAKAAASQLTGVPANLLKVAKESPLANTGITRYKLTDGQGKIYGVSLDSSGNLVKDEALRQAVKSIENRGFVNKLETALANRISQKANTPINVIIFLNGSTAPSRSNNQSRAQYESNLATLKNSNAQIQRAVVNQLQARGQKVLHQSAYAPVVAASVTPSQIQDLAARSDVKQIYLERVGAPRLNVSRVVVQADIVNGRGLLGTGQKVGVVEAGRIGTHPNLPTSRRILCNPEATTSISWHKTQVAGTIQSNDATNRGMAPDITIIDGIGSDFSDTQMIAATDCVIRQGASAINMSWGNETNGSFDAFARYADQVVYNTGVTISVAVSNICANKMGSPEIAFNVLAVGAFGDNNTTTFGDDIPACTGVVTFSAYKNPDSPHNDREKPDVVAPGYQILMPINGGGFANSSGTSFAAPQVAGGIGLLAQKKPALFAQVEEVRAIMMASARHNIEGNSRLSDRDGAGGIMLAAAEKTVSSGLSYFYSNNGAASSFPINRTFTATPGENVRVAIAWSHKMPAGNTMTEPTTDLDLEVFCGSKSLGISASYDSTSEIVEFTAGSCPSGYTAKISNFRPSSGYEFIGLAISKSDS